MSSKEKHSQDDLTAVRLARLKKFLSLSKKRQDYGDAMEYSCCFLRKSHRFRYACFAIIMSDWFEALMAFVILFNSCVLAAYIPTDTTNSTLRNQLNYYVSTITTIIFTIEMALKMIAWGMIGKKSYFTSFWNLFDCSIVIVGWIYFFAPLASDIRNISALRLLRLSTLMSSFGNVEIITQTLSLAWPGLVAVGILAFMIFFLFAMVGVELWNGIMAGFCGYQDPISQAISMSPSMQPCAMSCDQFKGYLCTPTYGASCGAYPAPIMSYDATGNITFINTMVNTTCLRFQNPDWGQTSFDNIAYAMLTSYVLVTTEGWTSTLYTLQDQWGLYALVAGLFIFHVMLGSYFILELTLAVMFDKYGQATSALAAQAEEQVKLLGQNKLREKAGLHLPELKNLVKMSGKFNPIIVPSPENLDAQIRDWNGDAKRDKFRKSKRFQAGASSSSLQTISETESIKFIQDSSTAFSGSPSEIELTFWERIAPSRLWILYANWYRGTFPPIPTAISKFASLITHSFLFSILVLLAILGNFISLGCVYYGMPDWYANALELSNYVFVSIFGLEFVLRLLELGPSVYFSSVLRLFDFVVIVISIVDLILLAVGIRAISGYSVFRVIWVFRILRIIPGTRQIMISLGNAVPKAVMALLLLLVVMSTFALLGMQLYGPYYQPIWDDPNGVLSPGMPYLNFSNLWLAMLTVFQVMDNENWNDTLHQHMAAFGTYNALFFLAIIFAGNYVFLNLFMLVLVDHIEAEDGEDSIDNQHIDNVTVAFSNLFSSLGKLMAKVSCFKKKNDSAPDSELPDDVEAGVDVKEIPAEIEMVPIDTESVPPITVMTDQIDSDREDNRQDSLMIPVLDSSPESGGQKNVQSQVLHRLSIKVPQSSLKSYISQHTLDSINGNPSIASKTETSFAPMETESQSKFQVSNRSLRFTYSKMLSGRVSVIKHQMESSDSPIPIAEDVKEQIGSKSKRPDVRPDASLYETLRIIPASDVTKSKAALNESPPKSSVSKPSNNRSSVKANVSMIPDNRGRIKSITATLPYFKKSTSSLKTHGVEPITVNISDVGSVSVARNKVAAPVEVSYERDNAFFILSRQNPFRASIILVTESAIFGWLSLVMILLSCINLALNSPAVSACLSAHIGNISACGSLGMYVWYIDYITAGYFITEIVLFMIANGVILGKHAYLRDPWNILDVFIVTLFVASLIVPPNQGQILRMLRAFQAIRPLRVIIRFPSLRLVVLASLVSLPRARYVLVVILLVCYVFAVIGVANFAGSFNYCNDPSIVNIADCVGSFNASQPFSIDPSSFSYTFGENTCMYMPTDDLQLQCELSLLGMPFPRIWQPVYQNFNNIGAAFVTVFELMTGENWPVFMSYAMNYVDPTVSVFANSYTHPFASFFYVGSQIILNMFIVELFVSVVIDTYDELRSREAGESLLTPEQRRWVHNMKMILRAKPRKLEQPPSWGPPWFSYLRKQCFFLVQSSSFSYFIVFFIFANLIVMGMRHYGETFTWVLMDYYFNILFTAIFALEAVLMIFGYGVTQYFSSWFNVFDFLIVIGAILSVAFNRGTIGTLLRLFRLFRVFRLFKYFKSLQRLVRTFVLSLPAFLNVFMILAAALFIFAIIGVNFFHGIRYGYQGFLTPQANFDTFSVAMLTLYRCTTGENFNGIMHDLAVQAPYCVPGLNCGVHIAYSTMYFFLFYLVVVYIIINILIAVIVEAYINSKGEEVQGEGKEFRLNIATIERFGALWAIHDPFGVMYIPISDVVEIIVDLPYPLGLMGDLKVARGLPRDPISRRKALFKIAENVLIQLRIVPTKKGTLHFHAVLQALIDRATQGAQVGTNITSVGIDGDSTGVSLKAQMGIVRIQKLWRELVRRRKQKEFLRKKGYAV
jgi:Ion transport protein